jgi:hypothetical protein
VCPRCSEGPHSGQPGDGAATETGEQRWWLLVSRDVDLHAACPESLKDQADADGPAKVEELVLLDRAAVDRDGRVEA